MESGVASLAVRLSSISANAAAAVVLIDRSITYISVIILGAVLFVARQAISSFGIGNSGPNSE